MKRSNAQTACLLTLFLCASGAAAQGIEQIRRAIEVDGVEREYLLLVPDNPNGNPLALVFNLHGSGGSPERQLEVSNFERTAAEHQFLAALPQGIYQNSRSRRSWNADLDPTGVDDVAFIRAIIEDVSRNYALDRSRIYSTGFSGGARMTSRLGCELGDVLAAVAPVGGIQFGALCEPAEPIAVLTFHGRADRVNHFIPNADSAPYWVNSVEDSIARWVEANHCSETTQTRPAQTILHERWTRCADDVAVEAYIIDDGGHTWPGASLGQQSASGGLINRDIDASELIGAFFERYRR